VTRWLEQYEVGARRLFKARFQDREEATVRGSITPKGLCGGKQPDTSN
jgi:hypothetical protein